jgi:hypothetical protein
LDGINEIYGMGEGEGFRQEEHEGHEGEAELIQLDTIASAD